ncbi:MAG: hypothetical protein R2932_17365 [Caldilineaceae bacterium]
MFHPHRSHLAKRAQIAVLGNPVRDAYLAVEGVNLLADRIRFHAGAAAFDIAYRGEPLRFGEKRYAQEDLSCLDLTSFTIRNGGGVYHTATQMAHLCRQRALPIAFCALDLVEPWPELRAAYAEWGIQHRSLGVERGVTNLILTNGQPERLILKSPLAPVALTPAQQAALRQQLPTRLDLLVVNSLHAVDLARTVMDEAQRRRVPQYSVLTPSLALDARLELQLWRDRASVCNLSEFALIADAFGLDCPRHEEDAAVRDVAAVMWALATKSRTGDLVVTLGSRGCVVANQGRGTVHHVALADTYRQQVQAHVQAEPARKNGVGDRFFGAFVLAHAFGNFHGADRTASAARWAALAMARQLAPGLNPTRDWMKLTPVPSGSGRGLLRKAYRYSAAFGQAKPVAAAVAEERLGAIELFGRWFDKLDAFGLQCLVGLLTTCRGPNPATHRAGCQ